MVVLVLLAVLIAVASPVLAEWVSRASTTEVVVRDPIVVADVNTPPNTIDPMNELDPMNSYIRRVTVSNISANRSYMITPQLLVGYDGANWDGINPPRKGVIGASQWVVVSVFDGEKQLTPGEAIVLLPKSNRIFTFYVWFSGDAWPGKYQISPWFSRSTAKELG